MWPGRSRQFDLWFPPIDAAGRVRADPHGEAVAGADDGLRLLALGGRGADPRPRAAEDLFAGWWQLLAGLGAVPRVLVWDGEGAVGRWRGGRRELTAECQAFRGTLATKVLICQPADPEAKGLVERATRLPGDARSCPAARSPRRPTSTPSSRPGWRW